MTKLDTGASCNCFPTKLISVLGINKDKINAYDNVTLVTYGNNKIKAQGSIILECIVKGVRYNIKFLLVKDAYMAILGLNACIKLNLIKRVDSIKPKLTNKEDLVEINKDIFSGTGKVPFEYKIKLIQNSTPYISACRRVPETLKPILKETLDDLIN